MERHRSYLGILLSFVILALAANPGMAQQYKMTTPIAPGIATPDKVDTSIGTLHLSDGNPDTDTVKKIYDNLDPVARLAGLPACDSNREPSRNARFHAEVWAR